MYVCMYVYIYIIKKKKTRRSGLSRTKCRQRPADGEENSLPLAASEQLFGLVKVYIIPSACVLLCPPFSIMRASGYITCELEPLHMEPTCHSEASDETGQACIRDSACCACLLPAGLPSSNLPMDEFKSRFPGLETTCRRRS